MSNPTISFKQLLAPMDVDKFLSKFYQNKPLHIKGEPKRFDSLFNWERLNYILNMNQQWDAPRMRLIRDGQPLPPTVFSRPVVDEAAGNVLRAVPALVSKHLADGATINLNEVEQLDENLAAVSRAFAMAFSCRSNCNLYLSRKEVTALDTHFDPTDVFVLHLSGRKRWKIYDQRFEAPAYVDGYQQASFPKEYHEAHKGRVLLQPTLSPGDVLYIPAGYYHDAMALTDSSLHLTYSIELVRGLVLAEILEPLLASEAIFREPLPDPDDTVAHDERIKHLATRMAERLTDPQVTAHIRVRQKNQAFWDVPGFNLPAPDIDQVFRVKSLRTSLKKAGSSIEISVDGRTFPVMDSQTAIVEWVLNRDAFNTGQLLAAFEDVPRDVVQGAVDLLVNTNAVESIDPYLA